MALVYFFFQGLIRIFSTTTRNIRLKATMRARMYTLSIQTRVLPVHFHTLLCLVVCLLHALNNFFFSFSFVFFFLSFYRHHKHTMHQPRGDSRDQVTLNYAPERYYGFTSNTGMRQIIKKKTYITDFCFYFISNVDITSWGFQTAFNHYSFFFFVLFPRDWLSSWSSIQQLFIAERIWFERVSCGEFKKSCVFFFLVNLLDALTPQRITSGNWHRLKALCLFCCCKKKKKKNGYNWYFSHWSDEKKN